MDHGVLWTPQEEHMPLSNQKLDRFTATILKEAVDESTQSIREYQERRDRVLAQAKREAAAQARIYVHDEVVKIRAQAGRQVSLRIQESKRTLFQRRNQISEEVFAEVRRRIGDYTAGPEYGERLEELLTEALQALDGADRLIVFLRPCDQRFEDALRELVPEVHLEFEEGAFTLGGLIAEAPGLGLRVDASFDSRLEELNGHFAELFGISLSDAE
jgi:vacuolar-type H+-ATPase subunit E/Vma4